jgi:predicted O-methyltransferase YrrM
MGTVALLEGLGSVGRVYTVDIDPISKKSDPWLSREDFESGRVVQVVSDMKAAEVFSQYTQQLADADLLFVDGPKDDVTEAAFLDLLPTVAFRKNPIIVFDDIRLINMLAVWRGIKRPKMDLTSFGHWSGTGLVDWKGVQLERGRI